MVCVSLVSQSCLILCDPVDYSLPGSSVHGILPGKNTGVGSVQFSHSVMSDSLRPHGLQHTRPPYPSPTPRACSNSCPLNQWCHPTISSSSSAFSSCLQSFPASEFFPMSRLFLSGGQSILASASASVLPMSIQGWLPWVISTWWASCDSDFRHIQVRRGSPNYPPKACLFWFLKGKNPSSCDPLPPSVSSKAVPSPLFTL